MIIGFEFAVAVMIDFTGFIYVFGLIVVVKSDL